MGFRDIRFPTFEEKKRIVWSFSKRLQFLVVLLATMMVSELLKDLGRNDALLQPFGSNFE